jgi:DNA ligase-1
MSGADNPAGKRYLIRHDMQASHLPSLRRMLVLIALAGVLQPCMPAPVASHVAIEASGAPSLLLAMPYVARNDLAAYLVSEKLDGVRAYWDGRQLVFRSGRVIHAPAWFTAGLPAHPLDGELWMGRHSFERLSAVVRRDEPVDDEWKEVSYQLYELPDGTGTFEDRLAALRASVERSGVPWLHVLPQKRIDSQKELQERLAAVVRAGGEGLMLHRADAPWQAGRSDTLLKLKPQLDDEAVVVAHEPGKGKYTGMLGALIVRTREGRQLRIGTGFTDDQRRRPPAIGSTITYRYRDLTSSGLPKFASFLRVRESE